MNRTVLGFAAGLALLLVIVVIAVQRRPQMGDKGPIRPNPFVITPGAVPPQSPPPAFPPPAPLPPPASPKPTAVAKPTEPSDEIWIKLGKLREGRATTDEVLYLQSVLDCTADYLGLEGAPRDQFIETTRQTAYMLREVETEFMAHVRQRNPAEGPSEAHRQLAQWRTGKINDAADTIRRSLETIKEKKRTEDFGLNLATWFDYLLPAR